MTGTPRPPEHFIHGEGRSVVVPWRIAAILIRQAGLAEYHQAHRGADPELDAVLIALKTVSAHWRSQVASVSGSEPRKEAEEAANSSMRMTSTEVADQMGVTSRAVRLACQSNRLRAELVGGRWLIDREDFEHFRTSQTAA